MNENRKKIVITTDGEVTTACLYHGKTRVKEARAACSPADKFSFETGASLALKRLVSNEDFVPHLESGGSGAHCGRIGEPTRYQDALGRLLCVGDVVELYDEQARSHGEVAIVKRKLSYLVREKAYVMGIECRCNDEDGTIGSWKILKKRSYEAVPHGEVVYGIRYVRKGN